jgi:shikimate kinase
LKRHVALLGFMAAGKSTAGRRLARALGREFFDTDELVARDHGPVGDIFEREGEAAFRRYESDALHAVLNAAAPCVLSLGGGALLLESNRHAVEASAYRLLIQVSPQRSYERLRRSRHVRPLLGREPSLERVQALYRERLPGYQGADYVVDADDLQPAEIAECLAEWLRQQGVLHP